MTLPAKAAAPVPPSKAIELKDDRGRTVLLPGTPQRIVSLLPSLTESVCALGECQRLVGVDRYSNHPALVRTLPVVGGGLDPSIEAIVTLKPDLVLLATSARVGQRLEALGLKVVALEPRSHADVGRVLRLLGVLLAVPEERGAGHVFKLIEDGMAKAAQALPAQARGARVYFEVGRGPYAAGASSFMGETLARLGLENVVPARLGPFPQLNPEFVVRANPDLIMRGSESPGGADYPGWGRLAAVQRGRVCAFSPEESDVLLRPGPRMPEAAQLMVACVKKHWR